MIVVQWLFRYVFVALFAYFFKRKEPNVKIRILYIHFFVICSIVLLMLAGARVEWGTTSLALAIFSASVLGAVVLLRMFGIGYSLSCVLQEWCLLLSMTYLAPVTGIPLAAAATAVPYIAGHRTEGSEWYWKPLFLFVWCVLSFYLYIWLGEPFVNVAIHTIVGSLLIKERLMYRYREEI